MSLVTGVASKEGDSDKELDPLRGEGGADPFAIIVRCLGHVLISLVPQVEANMGVCDKQM